MTSSARGDYGQDAPLVVRNMALGACAGFVLWASIAFGTWSGRLVLPLGTQQVIFDLTGLGPGLAIALTLSTLWMVLDSRVGKIRRRDVLLNQLRWSGDEQVLDVGCGRGLLLIAAAKRLTGNGRAVGIDLWQSEDLSGNHIEATLRNAEAEGVSTKISVKTADMRDLPFSDDSFDIILSRAAIHNIYDESGRRRAILEIARVLKPGGHALIEDINHGREYLAAFAASNCAPIGRSGPRWTSLVTLLLSAGTLRPVTLLVRKAD